MKKLLLILCGFCLALVPAAVVRAQPITNQPQSITVNNASSAMFTVGAASATNYQWQFNRANLADGTNQTDGVIVSGSATSTLILEDVTTNEAGSYTVILNGSVTSSNAVLTITNGTIVRFIFTGFFGGGTSNVDVQLFDHDKPATVQNFIHYINSGAYANMFMHRCMTGFVLQGGEVGATDQTNTYPPITGWDIASYIASNHFSPPFPAQVDSEYSVGPQIKNDFGTLAMALVSSRAGVTETNSATDSFFFNLADNSASLNSGDNLFTVFGRLVNNSNELASSNVLAYFSALTNGNGIVASDVFSDYGVMFTNVFPDLPVNFTGYSTPANANLVFCGFEFPAGAPPTDTTPPMVSITSPAPGAVLTNGSTGPVQGTASDDVGLADVFCVLTPQPAPDGTHPNEGLSFTNYALGTTNWSINLLNPDDPNYGLVPPGTYSLSVQAQDGAGNLSNAAPQLLIFTAILTNGVGSVSYIEGVSNLDAIGYPFQNTNDYYVVAEPGSNQLFVNWSGGGLTVIDPELHFQMSEGLLWTANFISNGIPNSIAFTYPPSNGIIGTDAFHITGTIFNARSTPLAVTCSIYSTRTHEEVANSSSTNGGTTNWSVAVGGLPVDSYAVEAVATDTNGHQTAISEEFTVAAYAFLQVDTVGPGTVSSPTNGEAIPVGSEFQVAESPAANQLFYTWTYARNGGSATFWTPPPQGFTMASGLTLTATFVSNTLPSNCITFTSPPASVLLSNGAVRLGGMISNVPSPPLTVTCQVFSYTNGLEVTSPVTTSGRSNWSLIMGGLGAGPYIALVKAVDQASNSTVIRAQFSATVNTNAPEVKVLVPATNGVLTDNSPMVISGTSSDSNGVAWVNCTMIPVANADGTLPSGGGFSAYAEGTTNWAVNFGVQPPGVYSNYVIVVDNAGNHSQLVQRVTNTGILINGNGNVTLTQNGVAKPNSVGYPLQPGSSYKAAATPGPGQSFLGWSAGAYTTTKRLISFKAAEGLLWTATFVPSRAGKGLAFTYPPPNAGLGATSFKLRGRMGANYKSAPIFCLISSLTTGFQVGPLLASNATATWSAAVSNLPPDNYVVEAMSTNEGGQGANIYEKFSILPFTKAVGSYSGLFIRSDGPVAPTNSGFVSFALTPSGTISGNIVFPAYGTVPIYSLPLENIYFTVATVSETIPDFYGKPLSLTINVDLTGKTDLAVGSFSSTAWSSPLICHRAAAKLSSNTMPSAGKYILSLQPGDETNEFSANGYAALTIGSGGGIALSGALPDNTTFSESARISREGIWPLYAVIAGDNNRGILLGWETNNASGECNGQLYWYKPPHVGAYYSGGIGVKSNMFLNSPGTNSARPAAGSQYVIVFEGGTIVPPLTNLLTVNEEGQFVVSNNPPDKLKISLSAYGVITGSFLNTNDNQTLRFKGAYLGPSQGGSGFIPETGGQTGSFELQLGPG
jgi:cyclophilin family peptidyl-prolyl cis-trans isomerase